MKKILDKIILSCLLYISIISLGYSLELNSKQAILIDYETGEILYKLNEKEKVYYEYTCHQEDIIRMCNVPSPQMTERDLIVEKELLAITLNKK